MIYLKIIWITILPHANKIWVAEELIYHTVEPGICVLVAYISNPGQEIHYVD
jgi:hypothetical protein